MNQARKPSVLALLVRVIVIAGLSALLAFTVGLFLGIAGIALADRFFGGKINLAHSYTHVALPMAGVTLVVTLVILMAGEVRRYREAANLRPWHTPRSFL